MSENTEYDFTNPFSADPIAHIKQKNEELQKRMQQPKSIETKSSGGAWFVVLVLMLSLGALGAFSLMEIKNRDAQLSSIKDTTSKKVAGVTDTKVSPTRITGTGFSVVMDEQSPEGYTLEYKKIDSEFLSNKTASVTSYMVEKSQNNEALKTGLEVAVVEYDNILDSKTFASKVLEKLGGDYTLASTSVSIPKDLKLSKLTSKNATDATYYTAVTKQNYYVIKVYNQTSKYSELVDYTRYTDKMLNNIYLN